VDPVPDPLLLCKCDSAGNRIPTSGSVSRNSDHYSTEAVTTAIIKNKVIMTPLTVWNIAIVLNVTSVNIAYAVNIRTLVRFSIYKHTWKNNIYLRI
jgi:hypothetical protein